MLYKRMGRPPKQPDQPIVCVTLRVPAHLKAHLIEMADAHGQGPLICFPDGSVKPFAKVLAEQGVR